MSNSKRVRRKDSRPTAFTLIETVLALSFLAIAAGLTLRVHQARMDFDHDSMNRLTLQLNVENVAERLSIVPYADLPDAVKQVSQENGFTADLDSFESENGSGWQSGSAQNPTTSP